MQVSDNLEKKEAVLSEVLSAANLDPVSFNQVSHQLEVCSLCPLKLSQIKSRVFVEVLFA